MLRFDHRTNVRLHQSACSGRHLLRAVLCLAALALSEVFDSGCREVHDREFYDSSFSSFVDATTDPASIAPNNLTPSAGCYLTT